ncbi:MAG TPA: hypothetical protein VGP87_03170 [Gemmatimonadales bacterium]|jgi:hypothetical protein|nr:hypothetical protein [Gemmatimonadales bacterium]
MSLLSPGGAALIKLMGDTPRGPRREGVFALWLTLRVAEDLLLWPPQPERGVKRRVIALDRRLSSLSIPAPLRRALVAALAELNEPRREKAGPVLQLLVAPAREVLGSEVADVLGRAARQAALRAATPS